MRLRVGTRGSKLGRAQTQEVIRLLQTRLNVAVDVVTIKTAGDIHSDSPLTSFDVKGIFEKEIDRAIAKGEVDFAVHSLKDVPVLRPTETNIIAVPERESPYDTIVSRNGRGLAELPSNSVVGTGSPRRAAQLHHLRPDLRVEGIRGNVDTRLEKLKQGLYDAVILAEAGLRRLERNMVGKRLALEDFTPCPGQGALAVVARSEPKEVVEALRTINHPPSMAEAIAERAFVAEIGGGCKVPIGAVARANDSGDLSLYASILSTDGALRVSCRKMERITEPEKLGKSVAVEMLRKVTDRMPGWRASHE
ncbi:MAG: hydroxymethylbilane synthase [Candidatus Bathyarchaeia archaeon]